MPSRAPDPAASAPSISPGPGFARRRRRRQTPSWRLRSGPSAAAAEVAPPPPLRLRQPPRGTPGTPSWRAGCSPQACSTSRRPQPRAGPGPATSAAVVSAALVAAAFSRVLCRSVQDSVLRLLRVGLVLSGFCALCSHISFVRLYNGIHGDVPVRL